MAIRSGALDPPTGSVYAGLAVSLPTSLLPAPLLVWVGGSLLCVRALLGVAAHAPGPSAQRFGGVVAGVVGRSIRRRSRDLAGGVIGVGLVVGFGTSLALFAGTYDEAKSADARFALGSDLRITPSVLATTRLDASDASMFLVPGCAGGVARRVRPRERGADRTAQPAAREPRGDRPGEHRRGRPAARRGVRGRERGRHDGCLRTRPARGAHRRRDRGRPLGRRRGPGRDHPRARYQARGPRALPCLGPLRTLPRDARGREPDRAPRPVHGDHRPAARRSLPRERRRSEQRGPDASDAGTDCRTRRQYAHPRGHHRHDRRRRTSRA